MLSIIIVIAIVLLSIVLAGIGIYVGMHNSDEKEESKPVIDVSGQYAAIGRPARETLTAVKPSEASIPRLSAETTGHPPLRSRKPTAHTGVWNCWN